MKNISQHQMDKAEAAYRRSTGSAPNRAGLRAALHQVETIHARLKLQAAEELLEEGLVEPALKLVREAIGLL